MRSPKWFQSYWVSSEKLIQFPGLARRSLKRNPKPQTSNLGPQTAPTKVGESSRFARFPGKGKEIQFVLIPLQANLVQRLAFGFAGLAFDGPDSLA
jgi:hypothetical protein